MPPSETTSFEKQWRRWGGTPADVIRLARRAEELLTAASSEDPRARVTVKRQRGEIGYASAAEAAEQLGELDLSTVVTVHIAAGMAWKDVAIIVNLFRTGAYLRVEGHGDHRLMVAGIAEVMTVELERRGRSYPHEVAVARAITICALILLACSIIATEAGAPRVVSLAVLGLCSLLLLGLVWIFAIRPHRPPIVRATP